MISVVHVITGLTRGGAEEMLVKLLSRTDRARFSPTVISLIGGGVNSLVIKEMGIAVHDVGMNRGVPSVGSLMRLRRLIASSAPDVIHTWMYHAALAALVVAPRSPVIVGVRQSIDNMHLPAFTRIVMKLLGSASKRADRICYVAQASREQHEAAGYATERALVIPNGFDTAVFAPRAADRASVRAELGLDKSAFLLGHVARYDPVKNHSGLISAFAKLAPGRPDAHLVMVGTNVATSNPALCALVAQTGLIGRIHLLGERADIPKLVNGFDVAVNASFTEGFCNALGEAMATGIPCVATAVGDSAAIVGDTGLVVPPGDPAALEQAMEAIAAMGADGRDALGARARARISERFSLDYIVDRYQKLYLEILEERNMQSA